MQSKIKLVLGWEIR